jgi:hypothetical protein
MNGFKTMFIKFKSTIFNLNIHKRKVGNLKQKFI